MTLQQKLIDVVYDHFYTTGEWPRTRSLQMQLRKFGNVARIAAEAGAQLIDCGDPHRNGVCTLTLAGIASGAGSEPLIDDFLRTIRAIAKRYIEQDSEDSIPVSEILAELGLFGIPARRISELVYSARGIRTGLTRSQAGEIWISPSPTIWYYESVTTLDEFDAAFRRATEDEQAARKPFYPSPVNQSVPAMATGDYSKNSDTRMFVSHERIAELKEIKSDSFDLTRLIRMCEELNDCDTAGCFLAMAMLTRAIIDHVPPIFGEKSFAAVASSHNGGKSFKNLMQQLSASARSIAETHLHQQIRRREVLPTYTQINFSQNLDVLLSEVVRLLRSP